MDKIKLYDYQQEIKDKTIEALKSHKSVLIQAETGAGKSVIIAELANTLSGRTLVLTHRFEILKQNAAWLKDLGAITSKVTVRAKEAKTVIAMVQTMHSRMKKYGANYYGEFDNIIVDEAHVQIFKKVHTQLNCKKLIGLTATPVLLGFNTYEDDSGVEWKQKLSMSQDYDKLIQGPQTSHLIDIGRLTKERVIKLVVPNFDRLPVRNSRDYTTKELNVVYNNSAAMHILLKGYEDYAKNKKTIIFNATTNVNKPLVEAFKKRGYDAKSYDTRNDRKTVRDKVLKWFKETDNAILINTGVFTTGLDVTDIGVVIVNRATISLALWRQMVGRGARIHEGKTEFITIDLGQNTDAHGMWHSDIDWNEHFQPQPIRKKRAVDLLDVWQCPKCGFYNTKMLTGEGDKCLNCGAEREIAEKKKHKDKVGMLVEVVEEAKPVTPSGPKIVEYTKSIGENANFAFKLLDTLTLNLVTKQIDAIRFALNESRIFKRIKQIYTPAYFSIIKSGLFGKRRKLSTQLSKIKNKIKDFYNG
jgi:superfamily II DNA or RNA helicase